MEIQKTNGKPASKQIQILANTIMEASINNSWLLKDSMKKEILMSVEDNNLTLKELEHMDEVSLNHKLAVYFALETWYSGYYGDFSLDFDSVQDFFTNWGS